MNTVTSADGTTIAFDRYGSGPTLILVGGALSTRRAAAELGATLGERFTTIAFDRRGRGDSGDTVPYAVEREVEDIAALIAAAGSPAHLFGHSSGAALALEATLRGLPIARLAVYEPPFFVDPGHPPLAADYRTRLRGHLDSGREREAILEFWREAVLVPEPAIAAMEPMIPRLEPVARTLPYDQAVLDATPLDVPDPLARFGSIAVPTLTIAGGTSPDWLTAPARRLATVIAGAQHVTLEGQGHGAATDVLAPVLAGFFGAETTATARS